MSSSFHTVPIPHENILPNKIQSAEQHSEHKSERNKHFAYRIHAVILLGSS
jgi:hypothetical protein